MQTRRFIYTIKKQQYMIYQKYHKTFLLVMMQIISLSVYPQKEIDGIFYQFNSELKEAKVTYHNKPPYKKYRGDILIPSTVNNNDTLYTVTGIGSRAFYACNLLTSVTIPNSIKTIDEEAFRECEELKTITVPGSITNIGKRAFYNCTTLESVFIQEGVTNIDSYSFALCYHLTLVRLPETLINISDHAFGDCSSLPSIILPKNLKYIGKGAFWDCISLTSIIAHPYSPPKTYDTTFQVYSNLYVPKGRKVAYKLSKYWKNFKISQM